MSTLHVLGATFGPSNVTDSVRAKIANNSLSFCANTETFGDPWPNKHKTFVLVYRFGTGPFNTIVCHEGSGITLTEAGSNPSPLCSRADAPGGICGAVWGLNDALTYVPQLGVFRVGNGVLGPDSMVGQPKSMTVVVLLDHSDLANATEARVIFNKEDDLAIVHSGLVDLFWPQLKNKTIRQTTMLGSHDAGMYCVNNLSRGNGVDVSEAAVKTQRLDFLAQLNAGVRYFDIRAYRWWKSGGPEWWCGHLSYTEKMGLNQYLGGIGARLDDLVEALRKFSWTARDIVFLDFTGGSGPQEFESISTPNDISVKNYVSSRPGEPVNGHSRQNAQQFYDALFNFLKGIRWLYNPAEFGNIDFQNATFEQVLGNGPNRRGCVVPIMNIPSGITVPSDFGYISPEIFVGEYSPTMRDYQMKDQQYQRMREHFGNVTTLFKFYATLTQNMEEEGPLGGIHAWTYNILGDAGFALGVIDKILLEGHNGMPRPNKDLFASLIIFDGIDSTYIQRCLMMNILTENISPDAKGFLRQIPGYPNLNL